MFSGICTRNEHTLFCFIFAQSLETVADVMRRDHFIWIQQELKNLVSLIRYFGVVRKRLWQMLPSQRNGTRMPRLKPLMQFKFLVEGLCGISAREKVCHRYHLFKFYIQEVSFDCMRKAMKLCWKIGHIEISISLYHNYSITELLK